MPTNSVRIHWPSWAGGYKPEAAPTLPGTASWTTVTNEPMVNRSRINVTNTVLNTDFLYPLHKP